MWTVYANGSLKGLPALVMFSTFVSWDNNNLTPAGVIFKLSLCEATFVSTYEKLQTMMLGEIDNKAGSHFVL